MTGMQKQHEMKNDKKLKGKVKVAIIGAGKMGRVHSQAYKRIPNVELIAIVGRESAVQLAEEHGCKSYENMELLLEQEEIDIIDICLPTDLHRQTVEQAAKAKKHIICEKPMANTLEDAQAMIQICQQEGVQLYMAHVLRFFPEYQRAYQLVQENALGQVGMVRTMRAGKFPTPKSDWYADLNRSGSVLLDLIIHDFDFLRWCFGGVERVYAKSLLDRNHERLDHAFVSLRFKNGVIAHVEGSWSYPEGFRSELEIAGSEGLIQHHSDESVPIKVSLRSSEDVDIQGAAIPESPLEKDPYQLQLEHFISCLEQEKAPVVSAEDAYAALQISLAALESVKSRRPVSLAKSDNNHDL